MPSLVRRKTVIAFLAAPVLLIAVALMAHRTTAKLVIAQQWVDDTHQVMTELDEFLSAVKDAQTGERGYIISGKDRYLLPYAGARELTEHRLLAIHDLTRDNASQTRHTAQLEILVATEFKVQAGLIDLRRQQGFEAARQVFFFDRGENAMDGIRGLVQQMQSEDLRLLTDREAVVKVREHQVNVAIVLGGLASFAAFLILGMYLGRTELPGGQR